MKSLGQRVGRLGCGFGAALLLLALLLYVLFTGPRKLDDYPPPESSPSVLPWAGGIRHFCVQGNRGVVSHRDQGEYAYDFAMPVGTRILAARAGTVVRALDRHTGNGFEAPNNYVAVRHSDGTTAWYLHIKKGGALVTLGQRVKQGQPLALSGNVGRSMLPHLHFSVRGRNGLTMPISFRDVKNDRGVPRMFKFYTSQNPGR